MLHLYTAQLASKFQARKVTQTLSARASMAVSSTRRPRANCASRPSRFVFEGDKIVLDPGPGIPRRSATVFDLFARESTAFDVVQRFDELGLRFPRRAYGKHGTASFSGPADPFAVLGILADPS